MYLVKGKYGVQTRVYCFVFVVSHMSAVDGWQGNFCMLCVYGHYVLGRHLTLFTSPSMENDHIVQLCVLMCDTCVRVFVCVF